MNGPPGRQRRPRGVRRARGAVLVIVLVALALIAVVAARFAQRIDELRTQTASWRAHADQLLQAGNARTAALYIAATRPLGPAGIGPGLVPDLWADGRTYALSDGGRVQLQDLRGLYPMNAPERTSLAALLRATGVGDSKADAMVDVLEDYIDTDHLKRLNGAERGEYSALGLPPPRNDWMLSLRELDRMPLWQDEPAARAMALRWGSLERRPVLNPNTAPLDLLATLLPGARPEQLALLQIRRSTVPFSNGEDAQRASGLPLADDRYVFHLGPELRITAWGEGAARAVQYNLRLLPAGRDAPWLITDVQPVPRAESRDSPDRAAPFPLAFAAARKP